MSARDEIDIATDFACGVGNISGLPVFEGRQRNLIELGLRRLAAAGYRIIPPGALDAETVERAAGWHESKADRVPHLPVLVGMHREYATIIRALGRAPQMNSPETATIFPVRKLDEAGRCCGRKPLHYKTSRGSRAGSDPHHFCPRCDAEYGADGTQRSNFSWKAVEGGFAPTYPEQQYVAAAIRSLSPKDKP